MKRLALTAILTLSVLPGTAAFASTGHASGRHAATIRISHPRLSVSQGRATKTTVFNRASHTMKLRVSGLPSDLRTAVQPLTVKAHGWAMLRVSTTRSTRPGRHRLAVSAIGAKRSAVVKLTVRKHSAAATARVPLAGAASVGPVPTHIPTWAYDDGCNGGSGASAALVRQWLTYAESNCGRVGPEGKALTDCHANGQSYCTAIEYLDTNRIRSASSVAIAADAQQSWWLHQPGDTSASGRLVSHDSTSGNTYLLNQSNSSVDAWFQSYVRTNFKSFDGLMMDDTASSASAQFYGTQASSSQEISTNSGVMDEHEKMAAAMTRADGSSLLQIDNGLSVNPFLPTSFPLLNKPASVSGLVTEGAPISDGTVTSYYSTLLDDMSYIDNKTNDFLVLLSYDTSGSMQARRVQAATVLLGYSPGQTVSWSDLQDNGSDLSVWPEEGIVPTDPVQSMGAPGGSGCLAGEGKVCSSGGHTDIEVASGIYRREFKTCYNQGVAFGSCAVIMNDTSRRVTVDSSWLKQSYAHQVTMSGGDVQSGGTVSLNGAGFAPGSTTIPADDATLLSA